MNLMFKIILAVVLFIILISLFFRVVYIKNSIKNGKKLYCITVHSNNGGVTYVTNEYEVDDNTKCVRFKDEFGFKNTICGFYTITTY